MSKGQWEYYRWKDVIVAPNRRCLPLDREWKDADIVWGKNISLYNLIKLFENDTHEYSHSEINRKLDEKSVKVDGKVITENMTFTHGIYTIRYTKKIVIDLWVCTYRHTIWDYIHYWWEIWKLNFVFVV
jgi:hypothetical protein